MNRTVSRRIAAMLAVIMCVGPILPAYAEEPCHKKKKEVYLAKLAVLQTSVDAMDERIDSIESCQGQLLAALVRMGDCQDEIDKRIAVLCEGDKELEEALDILIAEVTCLRGKIGAVACDLTKYNCELQKIRCTLSKVSCILHKLPDNIRRAKIRAFMFGFLVGMGVGAAIGGGGGGVGALGSVSPW